MKNKKARLLNNEVLEGLKNGVSSYKQLCDEILINFDMSMENLILYFNDGDIRIYNSVDHDVILDAWFRTQDIYSGDNDRGRSIEIKDNVFNIIPPNGDEDGYIKSKLEYENTEEGLIEAFYNTQMPECIMHTKTCGDMYICVNVYQ